MAERGIEEDHILKAVQSSDLVCRGGGLRVVVHARNKKDRRLDLVCDYESERDILVLITVYEPGARQ